MAISTPKKKAARWGIEEDKQLCAAWLNTSRESIVGTGQKSGTFWEQVHQLYSNFVLEFNKDNKRSKTQKLLLVQPVNAVKCCWGNIMQICNKFGGCYLPVERQMRSGMSCNDIVDDSTFNLDHFWGILCDHPKWQATQHKFDLRKKKLKEPKSQSTTISNPSSTPLTNKIVPSSGSTQPEEEDDLANHTVIGSEKHPKGQESAKRKQDEDAILDTYQKSRGACQNFQGMGGFYQKRTEIGCKGRTEG
ncbi:hypothetical protein PTTG_27031 [Puccinia triticina 1-1 BBBD Race 1]|uniref:NAM-associated domain-containing protein n=1 Tax=Puccinia triticina (isolate 1-1 / race 1 (BBBD)) TaxID=630390 RepID=A0A180GQP2_PUCT1|nr:hypothetical protein PTTG_27031 [Puccinia triticina 1-1 BBBD Race 1]